MNFFRPITVTTLWLCLLLSSSSWAHTELQDSSPQVLRGNWFYHWGDLPKDQESGQWQYHQAKWTKTEFPENLKGRQGKNILWVKIDLPSGNWRDPYLFISAVDLTMEVFHKRQEIYHFGKIDAQGNSRFEGWPWHVFHLPNDYDQHPLYFRIFSDYPSIGLSGEASIGNRFNLLDEIYGSGIAGLSFILVVLLVGIISTIMGTIKKDRAVAISTGMLSFNLAIMMFSENELSQVVLFEPLFWRYVAAFSYFLIPAFLSIIVLAWLKEKPPLIARIVLGVTLTFVLAVAALSAFTEFNFVNAYPYFDVLFIILVLALLSGCKKLFYQQGLTGSLMTFGILTLFVSLLLDMLSAHGFISWIGHAGQWGLILFTLASLMIYFVRDWQQQIALNSLTQQLESKVLIRTAELQASQNKLEKLAQEDYLTTLLNRRAFTERAVNEVATAIRHQRPISLLLFDLDHFKPLNDTYGHVFGDQVLAEFGRLVTRHLRTTDSGFRYGGEEFVVLMPFTPDGSVAAERIRAGLENKVFISESGEEVRLTVSGGIANYRIGDSEETLVKRADKALYQSKENGRNQITML